MKTYYLLTKPGIIMGNLITMIAGFALACTATINPVLFLQTLVGLGLVIASACVCNNYIDRHADKQMKRTKNRPTIGDVISSRSALLFALALGLIGLAILAFFANYLAAATAFLGFFIYVSMYSLLKKHTKYATLVGSISGAIPPVVGYVAVSNRLDLGALLIFAILVLWQMPHFYAIAIRHANDYEAASIPVLPVSRGIPTTKIHMLLYLIAFALTIPLLTYYGYAGYWYLAISSTLALVWLVLGIRGFKTTHDVAWARQMFIFSLITITGICGVIVMNH